MPRCLQESWLPSSRGNSAEKVSCKSLASVLTAAGGWLCNELVKGSWVRQEELLAFTCSAVKKTCVQQIQEWNDSHIELYHKEKFIKL